MGSDLSKTPTERLKQLDTIPVQNWSLDDWVLNHHSIYGANDRNKSAVELWLQAVTEGARLAESIRRGQVIKVLEDDLVGLFGWLCAFVGKYLYQVAYRKGFEARKDSILPAELVELIRKGDESRKAAWRRYAENDTLRHQVYGSSVDQLVDRFIWIYGGGHPGVEVWQVAAHLLEEIGEVADELAALSELKMFERSTRGEQPQVRMVEVVEKAYSKAGGRPGSALENVKVNIIGGGEHTIIDTLRWNSIRTLKEELADVFSWVSALLFQIGETMREVTKNPKAWYAFCDYLKESASVCFACKAARCEQDCRAVWHVRKVFDAAKRSLLRSGALQP